ncbi:ADP-ribosylglycohydrolase family protein [Streptomyces iconiensis]|uniref:ADP-ribosylglycohydrolase family protein n=1 Tax=Streptomyces iconiensis TaxID=1384038 RepID=A0ABT6ZP98_9ACTN|nr:ADP-ribosylglycohydrolase family protein [Streptomyces iconiensis]MDJ1130879.1 ADP-ribosylglycohydrolase family protein [Streptomyces iconiensis]
MSAEPHDLARSERVSGALASLRGLAVGDALGSQFFVPDNHVLLRRRELPSGPWQWTDDTEMACSLFAVLSAHGHADQEALAASFAEHHDSDRGYGPAVNRMLRRIRQEGADWRELAASLFEGQGSWGNGAAMRVAPLGAWFADDAEHAAEQAERSARVTHTHPEAVAGTRAVAAATALTAASSVASVRNPVNSSAANSERGSDPLSGNDTRPSPAHDTGRLSGGRTGPLSAGHTGQGPRVGSGSVSGPASGTVQAGGSSLTGSELLGRVQELVPRSAVRAGVRRAADMLDYADVATVAAVLGCGRRTSAHDTVPFALWAAARHAGDFREAVWATAQAGGDIDTTCAIVGGIVAAGGPGGSAPPQEWTERTEELPPWLRDSLT